MPIVINFKICDNAAECNGIPVCPTKALTWDKEAKSLVIDNSKCIACGKCAKACPVQGAILVAKSKEEFEKLRDQVESDQRTRAELLEDRYGVAPTDPGLILTMKNFDEEVLKSDRVVLVDFWDEPHVACRVKSIPFKALSAKAFATSRILDKKPGLKMKFRKIDVQKNPEIAKRYNIEKIPSLFIFWKGKVIGRIEGAVELSKESDLTNKIAAALKKLD